MLIIWRDSFNTGYFDIDEQHKGLISLVNKMDECKKSAVECSTLESIFGELSQYTKMHFIYEEKMLAAKNYPDYMRHKREHEIFIKRLDDLIDKI